MAGHLGLHVSWAASVDLNATFEHILSLAKDITINVDTELGNPIDPFWPSLIRISFVSYCILELFYQFQQLALCDLRVCESLFQIFIGDFVERHSSSC